MYDWLNEDSQQFLDNGYLNGCTVDERVNVICNRAEELLGEAGYASALKHAIQRGWVSLSTPIWANFGTDRGLPISCFGSHIDDTWDSIAYTHAEVSVQCKNGGGTAVYVGDIRERGAPIAGNGTSHGPTNMLRMYDTLVQVTSQGNTRRGNCAAYMPIDHPDILEFLRIRSDGHPIQDLLPAVTVTDSFMNRMIDGDMNARHIWAKVLEARALRGLPYIIFIDNVNASKPSQYADQQITHSQMCTEIFLPTNKLSSFVCCLASMNVRLFEVWRGTDTVSLVVKLLDAVHTEFIAKAKRIRFMERSVKFAEEHRAIGIGQLGWASYLHQNMIPFDSMVAIQHAVTITKTIQRQADVASHLMATRYGGCLYSGGRRHTTLTAIAPTKSSAFVLGESESVEQEHTNYGVYDRAKIKHTYKNKYLRDVLASHGLDTETTWRSILTHGGSVQHLTQLSSLERAVFRTISETSPLASIAQASARVPYIDQGQSLNLHIHPSIPVKDVNALMIHAWRSGIKSLYYQYSVNAAQEFSRDILNCSSCEA